MAQGTWVSYTTRVELSLRPRASVVQPRSVPLLARRLRWILVAAATLATAPLVGALSTAAVQGPASNAPATISQIAGQARDILSATNYEVTMPLQVAKVTPPPPPVVDKSAYGATFAPVLDEPSTGTIKGIILTAAQTYDVSYTWLLGVAECESGLDPTDVNRSSGASGLFQFMPATFYGHGGTDIWDPTQQAGIAAKMFADGESSEWVCK
jgi:soluble lytic murein transglycosylase-like protein